MVSKNTFEGEVRPRRVRRPRNMALLDCDVIVPDDPDDSPFDEAGVPTGGVVLDFIGAIMAEFCSTSGDAYLASGPREALTEKILSAVRALIAGSREINAAIALLSMAGGQAFSVGDVPFADETSVPSAPVSITSSTPISVSSEDGSGPPGALKKKVGSRSRGLFLRRNRNRGRRSDRNGSRRDTGFVGEGHIADGKGLATGHGKKRDRCVNLPAPGDQGPDSA
ncbi:Zinc finger PHD-finger [Penicillium bovifimosum]|uniref:Zinc finger PHD-finger n=1 Tax=Penicillium bovifimosum TaxID=126998 RepID=A0A9W9GJ28_9EURO|nr:Zinc finger PHD-finger [Penicillium bovifimosum]KAJ5121368.1 Zinc finger PHD-finger [Penicillium bovifimosum]